MKLTLLCSISRSDPVLDNEGEPVKGEASMFGRKQTIVLHDHTFHPAQTVVDIEDKKEADELIKRGFARKYSEELDSALPGAQDDEDDEADEGDAALPPTESSQRRNAQPVKGKTKGKGRGEADPLA